MPSHDHHHHSSSSSSSSSKSKKTKVMTIYLWQCHICGLDGMAAVTQQSCANCVHVRCPECLVVVEQITDDM